MAKRKRATVVIRRGDLVLLVRERGQRRFGLPGGKIEKWETSLIAGAREVYGETRLKLSSIRYVGDIEHPDNVHFVFLAECYGRVRIQEKELLAYKWWDGKESLPLQKHVGQAMTLIQNLCDELEGPPGDQSAMRGGQ